LIGPFSSTSLSSPRMLFIGFIYRARTHTSCVRVSFCGGRRGQEGESRELAPQVGPRRVGPRDGINSDYFLGSCPRHVALTFSGIARSAESKRKTMSTISTRASLAKPSDTNPSRSLGGPLLYLLCFIVDIVANGPCRPGLSPFEIEMTKIPQWTCKRKLFLLILR
jgi:hypothetical protein